MKTLLTTTAFGVALLLGNASPAGAAGCIKGAVVGGLAGHAAGHGVLGAAGGCAVGRHLANRNAARNQGVPSRSSAPDSSYNNGGAYSR